MKKEKEVTAEVEVSKMIDKVWRPAMTALIAAGVGYGGFIGYRAYEVSKENAAQEKLFLIQKSVEDKLEELTKPDEEKVTTGKKLNKKEERESPKALKEIEKSPESLVKNFESQIQSYEKFIENHKGHKASYMAAIQLAGLSVEYKDLSRAEKVLSGVVERAKNDLFGGLVTSHLGTVLMDQKKYKEAIEQFSSLVDDKKQTYFHPQALLRLGTCYLETGDFGMAETTFKKIEVDFPSTQAASEAKNLIKLIALKKGDKV